MGVNDWDTVDHLFTSWLEWAARNGERDISSKRFSQQLEDEKFVREKRSHEGGRGSGGLRVAGVFERSRGDREG